MESDSHNPDTMIVAMYQGGTRLPDRSYYLEEKHSAILAKYNQHVTQLFAHAGWSPADAAKAPADVLAVETGLAKVQWEREKLRDAHLTYNKIDRVGLEKITPGMDWARFFAASGRAELTQINVACEAGEPMAPVERCEVW